MLRPLVGTLAGLDPDLEKAARDLGAAPQRAFRTITLLQLVPGLVAGATFAFVEAMDNLSITVFLTNIKTTTLLVKAYSHIRDIDDPTVAAMATVLVAVSLVLVFASERVLGLDRFLDTSQGGPARPAVLGRARHTPAALRGGGSTRSGVRLRCIKAPARRMRAGRHQIQPCEMRYDMLKSTTMALLCGSAMMLGAAPVQAADAPAQAPATPALQPQIDAIKAVIPKFAIPMREVGDRFQNMYFAAKDGNWALAAYMSKYMNGAMTPASLTKPKEYKMWATFYNEDFAGVNKAIQAKDLKAFEAAYTNIIANCNECHKGLDYGFIKVVKQKLPADLGIDYTVKSEPGDVPK